MEWLSNILAQLAVWETQGAAWLNKTFRLHELAVWLQSNDPKITADSPIHAFRKQVQAFTAGNIYNLPLVSWVHIVGVAIVCGSVVLISLRMMGLLPSASLAAMTRRLLPWTWLAIVVNIATGFIMVIDRPTRALDAGTFPYKMLFLVTATALTIYFWITVRTDPDYWEKTGFRRSAARVLGLVSLLLWVGIIIGGRWIFYSRLPNALIVTRPA